MKIVHEVGKPLASFEKNYQRLKLEKIAELTNQRPFIVKATFHCKQLNFHSKHVCFTTVRPVLIPNDKTVKVLTICNHINITKEQFNKYFKFPRDRDKKYYLIVGIYSYQTNSIKRYGLRLCPIPGYPAIMVGDELRAIFNEIKPHIFDLGGYLLKNRDFLSLLKKKAKYTDLTEV